MKIAPYILALCSFSLLSCTTGTMEVESYDGQTGVSTRKVYSKYYDGGVWLKPKQLGLQVVVDHEKRSIPVVSGVQQSLGALGPSDSFAAGKITLYLWNFGSTAQTVRILAVNSIETLDNRVITAVPKDRTGAEVCYLRISNYGTELTLKVDYELNGRRSSVTLKLPRRTIEENKRNFKNPVLTGYPWYAEGMKEPWL